MTAQASLFDAPAARATDRATATAAAESMTGEPRVRQADLVLTAVADEARRGRGSTAHDVVMWCSFHRPAHVPQQSVVARRLTDLARAGLVEDTLTSRPGTSGRLLTVWTVTDEGRLRVAQLTEGDTP